MNLSTFIKQQVKKDTYDGFSQKTGIPKSTLQAIVSGNYQVPTNNMLDKIVTGLGITRDDLLSQLTYPTGSVAMTKPKKSSIIESYEKNLHDKAKEQLIKEFELNYDIEDGLFTKHKDDAFAKVKSNCITLNPKKESTTEFNSFTPKLIYLLPTTVIETNSSSIFQLVGEFILFSITTHQINDGIGIFFYKLADKREFLDEIGRSSNEYLQKLNITCYAYDEMNLLQNEPLFK